MCGQSIAASLLPHEAPLGSIDLVQVSLAF
nr:MAG TPA: hypothetical protein [Caudoviricetes sp.]